MGGASSQFASNTVTSTLLSAYNYNLLYGLPADNFKNPKVTAQRPFRVKGTCVCLNADGTPNKEAFIYNGNCYKCSSKRDVFYGRGELTTNRWSAELPNQVPVTTLGSTTYMTIDDAKQACESTTSCAAVLQGFETSSGYATYTLASSIQAAGSGTTGKPGWVLTRGSASNTFTGNITGTTLTITGAAPPFPTVISTDSPILLTGIGVADGTRIVGRSGSSNYTVNITQSVATTTMTVTQMTRIDTGGITTRGSFPSSSPIPRAFADDYVSPDPLSKPSNTLEGPADNLLSNAISYISNIISISSAMDNMSQDLENQNAYYRVDGTNRKLLGTPAPKDVGICVGPCDSQHPLYDDIQLLYNGFHSESGVQKGLYTLRGTTCYDATKTIIDQPSIPATYVPQVGDDCDNSAASGYGGSQANIEIFSKTTSGSSSYCQAECPYGSTDDGNGRCIKPTIKRPFVQPSYSSCPAGYKKVDSLCVAPCDPGFELDGEYCVPTNTVGLVALSNTGSSGIKCTAQPYTATVTTLAGSSTASGSRRATKWLCDTPEDVSALLAGPSTSGSFSTYTTPNDIVCVADDPTTGMYFCQSIEEAKANAYNDTSTDYYNTCDNLVKAYYDLSNNLTILAQANSNAQITNRQLQNITLSLQGAINAMCPSGTSSSTCNLLLSQMSQLQTSISTGGSRISSTLNPIALAIESRAQLVAQMNSFQCYY